MWEIRSYDPACCTRMICNTRGTPPRQTGHSFTVPVVMSYVAVSGARLSDPGAGVRVHGYYGSQDAADGAARRLATEQPDIDTYVIDVCQRWIVVRNPVAPDASMEASEVDAPENTDPGSGRMGSVCDLLHRGRDGAATDVGQKREELRNVFSTVQVPSGPSPWHRTICCGRAYRQP